MSQAQHWVSLEQDICFFSESYPAKMSQAQRSVSLEQDISFFSEK